MKFTGGRRDLKAHMGKEHGSFKVFCVFCTKRERVLKRVSDLKVHVVSKHPQVVIDLPEDVFSEANGFWWSLFPRDYAKFVTPTSYDSAVARKSRHLVMEWVNRVGSATSKTQECFLTGWRVAENLQISHHGPARNDQEYTVKFINLTPGSMSVDLEASEGGSSYRVYLESSFLSDTQAMRAVTRKLASIAGVSKPISQLDAAPEARDADLEPLARAIGIEKGLIASVRQFKLFGNYPSQKRPAPSKMVETEKKRKIDENNNETLVPPMAGLGNDDLGVEPRSDASTPVLDETPVTESAPAFIAPPVTARSVPATFLSIPSYTTSKNSLSLRPTASHQLPAQPTTTSAEVLDLCIRNTKKSSSNFNSSGSRSTDQEPPMPHLSTLGQDYRASQLLRRGCMPQLQPARREWKEGQVVQFVEGDFTLSWPPKNFTSITPDQKLLQWEFAAMSLLRAKGEDTTAIDRCTLLDTFNFLALPGTAGHRTPKSKLSPLVKARYFTYEALRRIALGQDKNEKYLALLECGAMMRDTRFDKHLETCALIHLRLCKSKTPSQS